ncbi:MAG: hydrolase family protein [Chitinophagaceae bacterium]|nr:hydrolase family protein [Chitinophagaceae bacterium]
MKKQLVVIAVFFLFTSFSRPEITWLALGDSITYLNDHLNETGNRVTKGYLTMVKEKLPYINFINKGYNGWTVVRIAESIDKLGLTKADVYTVLLGTNDWWHSGPLGAFTDYQNSTGTKTVYGAYRVIIDKLKSLNPKAKFILITPLQRSDFVSVGNKKNNAWGSYKEKDGQWLEQFAEAVKSIGKYEHFDVVDLYHNSGITQKNMVRFKRLKNPQTGIYKDYHYPAFVNIPFNPETDDYPYPVEAINMTYDGLHPSDKGNKIIAKMLVKVLRREGGM